MGRESKLLAKTNPLIVDYFQSITEVSRLAMEREEEDLYDDVIVTKDGRFSGVVRHIGGDDFMAIIPHYDVEPICQKIIEEFDGTIPEFYDSDHLSDPTLKIKGRSGQMENISIMSLSIAVITNQEQYYEVAEELSDRVAAVKRDCKKYKGSCYIIDKCDCSK
ncbi:hypothetical protein RhiirA1_483074 [Rhizophagus irregularis]|uniref:GGDEF domain-containing protein n=1 Tax=Rhizophagus irregularis TaxID=588596 RepID=A0A2N0QL18_9GLOM|nr:hypothetical protein RhiirA1_483074 [Rhizophagus irregularis]